MRLGVASAWSWKQCFVHSHLSLNKWWIPENHSRKPPACRECLWPQWFLILGIPAGRGWSAVSLGTSIPAPAGTLTLSAGSLDELTVIVTSNDLELHWLPLLYTLLFYPLIKLKNQTSQWVVGCRGWFCTATASHLLAELGCDLPEASLGVWYDAFGF